MNYFLRRNLVAVPPLGGWEKVFAGRLLQLIDFLMDGESSAAAFEGGCDRLGINRFPIAPVGIFCHNFVMSSSSPTVAPPGDNSGADSPPGDNGNAMSPPVDNGNSESPPPPVDNGSSPPSGNNGNAESPPGNTAASPPPGDSVSPPAGGNGNTESPPGKNTGSPPGNDTGNKESPPPPSGSSPPPPSPPHSPPTPSTSPPSVDHSPPLPVNSPAVSPPPSETPPSNNGDSQPAPSNSNSPPSSSTPVFYPPPAVFPQPAPGAGASQRTPSPALSTSPPRLGPGSSTSPSSPRPSSSSSDSGGNASAVAGILGGGSLIIILLFACLLWSRKRKRQPHYANHGQPPPTGVHNYGMDHVVKLSPVPPGGNLGTPVSGWGMPPSSEFGSHNSGQHPMQSPNVGGGGYGSKSQFTFDELSAATNGFSQANVLGQGGFGFVHKGVLPDGKEVAVKSLKAGSGQGEREFQAEVEIISRVHHRHLVSLVGYCIAGDERLLVYEFVPNKTLEFHLHGNGEVPMDWASRLQIARGSAKGLAYLHEDCEPRIIHRDIKSANILLDSQFEAKVADFGLAKLTSDNYTHVSTRVMGTFGYLAPEYAASGKLSEKSDVFSFGVMLLELITGRRPVDPTSNMMEDSLVDWARGLMSQALEDGDYSKLADPRLEDSYVRHEMASMVACASSCVRHSARRRPRMSQVVRALEGDSSLDDLNGDGKGGQSGTAARANPATDVYDTRAYNADLMKFKKMILPTQEFNSGSSTSTSYNNPSSTTSESADVEEEEEDEEDDEEEDRRRRRGHGV
ncbi:hypothetical protein M569_11637 [Genlisea aurea]|uniref:non-specific serine/threonine protein kinase n=1 Tax=Genlisea aurea TaxID=192259 RepID=S8C8K5_9LAMI|nr:hypothetical protein M569_11637 [Genlisea aurea]